MNKMTTETTDPEKTETISILFMNESMSIPDLGKLILREKGNISVESCKSEADAFKFLSKKKYDVIVSGCKKAECGGSSFIRHLREKRNETPVIIFTPKGNEEAAISLLNDGADYYIRDEGDPETLYSELSEKIVQLVTKRKRESIIKSFFYSSNDLMFVKDENFRYLIANDAALDFFNVKQEELGNKTDFDIMEPEIAGICHNTDKEALKTGKPVFTEEYIGDRYFRCMKFPLEISLGKTGVGAIIRDITERKKAEEELKSEKELFSQTFESLQDAAFVLEGEPVTIKTANIAAVKLFGYNINEMTGKNLDLIHVDSDAMERFNSMISSFIGNNKKVPRIEFRMKRKNGTVFPAEHSISALYDSGGNQKGWVHIVRDITSKKEAEMREKAALIQIEENMEQLATLNDQIRNPLAVITGLADLKCPKSAKEIMEQVNEIDRMIKMLDEGWIRSEKIWAFLKKHYGLGDLE